LSSKGISVTCFLMSLWCHLSYSNSVCYLNTLLCDVWSLQLSGDNFMIFLFLWPKYDTSDIKAIRKCHRTTIVRYWQRLMAMASLFVNKLDKHSVTESQKLYLVMKWTSVESNTRLSRYNVFQKRNWCCSHLTSPCNCLLLLVTGET
jgi:hypothetical protein